MSCLQIKWISCWYSWKKVKLTWTHSPVCTCQTLQKKLSDSVLHFFWTRVTYFLTHIRHSSSVQLGSILPSGLWSVLGDASAYWEKNCNMTTISMRNLWSGSGDKGKWIIARYFIEKKDNLRECPGMNPFSTLWISTITDIYDFRAGLSVAPEKNAS